MGHPGHRATGYGAAARVWAAGSLMDSTGTSRAPMWPVEFSLTATRRKKLGARTSTSPRTPTRSSGWPTRSGSPPNWPYASTSTRTSRAPCHVLSSWLSAPAGGRPDSNARRRAQPRVDPAGRAADRRGRVRRRPGQPAVDLRGQWCSPRVRRHARPRWRRHLVHRGHGGRRPGGRGVTVPAAARACWPAWSPRRWPNWKPGPPCWPAWPTTAPSCISSGEDLVLLN